MYRLEYGDITYYINTDTIAYISIGEYSANNTAILCPYSPYIKEEDKIILTIVFTYSTKISLYYNTIEEAQNIADNICTFKHSNHIVSGFK